MIRPNIRKLTFKFNSTTTVRELSNSSRHMNLVYCNYDTTYLSGKQSIVNTLISDNYTIHNHPVAFMDDLLAMPGYNVSISYVINGTEDLHSLIKMLGSIENDHRIANLSLEIFSHSFAYKQCIIAYAADCLQNCKIYIH